MKKLLRWLHWLMILPFGLFLYVGVKGCVYLLSIRYEGSGSLIPLVSDFLLGGILGIALILVISYALAPQGKIAAVVGVALFQFGLGTEFWSCFAVYLIIQGLDGNLLVPVLFSEAVNLHPLVIILSVVIFGGLWGFWGVFFAIPLATLIKAVVHAWPDVPAVEEK